MADLVAAARADPGAISWGGTSVGSQDHLSVLLLEKAAGVKFNFVSFAGAGEVLAALLGGHIEVGSAEPVVAQPHARAKKLRILGLMSDERLASVPDVPTLREQGLDVVLNMQRGVVAASGIPADARGTLVQAFRRMAAMPEWKAYLAEEGLRDAFLADDDYGRFLGQETQRWGTLLREAGLAR
jgi:putative tricarboxylic transport membrane protein